MLKTNEMQLADLINCFYRLLANTTLRMLSLAILCICVSGSTPNRADAQQAETQQQATDNAKLEFFETRIRPVLVQQCYECHNSSDAAEGGLILDHRQPMAAGGASGTLIIPGAPSRSRLIQILRHEIEGLEMPEGGEKLPPEVLTDFENWIRDGAVDPRDNPPSAEELEQATSWEAVREKRKAWWSFQPIVAYPVPPAPGDKASSHPIDRFIDARLSESELIVAQRASEEVLVRRLFYALLGLPPTYEQVFHWSARLKNSDGEERETIYAQLVDELLSSPRFGERWGRHWMDWIRYAESHGSEGDPGIDQAWQYRDYLIRAMNDDVPVNQLILEHIAGDLLEDVRANPDNGIRESWIGPAHFRMVFHGFAPTDALDERVRFTDDQINSISKAFLGLTISCARCHDHKFDPISQEDYYALYGILTSCRPGRIAVNNQEDWQQQLNELDKIQKDLIKALSSKWQHVVDQWDADSLSDQLRIATSEPNLPHLNANDFKAFWDFSEKAVLLEWYPVGTGLPQTPANAGKLRLSESGDKIVDHISLNGVAANLLSTKLPARLSSPDIFLKPGESAELWVLARGGGGAAVRYAVQDYPRNGTVYPVQELSSTWTWHRFDLSYWAGDSIHVEVTTAKDAPLLVKPQTRSWFDVRYCLLAEKGQFQPPTIEQRVEKDKTETSQDDFVAMKSKVQKILQKWPHENLNDQAAWMLNSLLENNILPNQLTDDKSIKQLVDRYRSVEQSIPQPTRVPALEETVGEDQPLFVRGNHKQPSHLVARRFLEVIDATPYRTSASGRLEFARDLLREDNPLTRRVMVNRVWLHLFGQGIVNTPDNFGRVGDKPSHPKLLDWLAIQFAKNGWSLKSLIRLIVTSQAWQRDVVGEQQAAVLDAENRLLSHQNVRRLDAESIRDSLFALSGKLQHIEGGPPVTGTDPRRSVYVSVIRNNLDPFLRVFDFPEPFSTVGRRDVTNVPAQSLTLMNDPLVKKLAGDFASRTLEQFPDASNPENADKERARWMLQQVLQRRVDQQEVEFTLAQLTQLRQHFEATRTAHQVLLEQIDSKRSQLDQLKQQVRTTLEATLEKQETANPETVPLPLLAWEFDSDEGVQLHGEASIANGELILGGGYALTQPIPHALTAKTIEAIVQLDSLEQSGGGVVSIQSSDGVKFDAIVFGERDPRHWLAGSNNFSRTDSFSAIPESEANITPVHFAIVYDADGHVTGYRNGVRYGKSYLSNGPFQFSAGDTIVGFGIRHLPAGGNRILKGKLLRASIFDRALSEQEINALANSNGPFITDQQLIAAMDQQEKLQADTLTADVERLDVQLKQLEVDAVAFDESTAWKELAHALFTLKEFIYVR